MFLRSVSGNGNGSKIKGEKRRGGGGDDETLTPPPAPRKNAMIARGAVFFHGWGLFEFQDEELTILPRKRREEG